MIYVLACDFDWYLTLQGKINLWCPVAPSSLSCSGPPFWKFLSIQKDWVLDTNLLVHVFLVLLYELLYFHPSHHQLSSHQGLLNE